MKSLVKPRGVRPKVVSFESSVFDERLDQKRLRAKGYHKLACIIGSYPELLVWVMALLSFLGNVGDTRGCEHPFI